MEFVLKTQYWNDSKALSAFKEFMITIHDLDFTKLQSTGYWDDAYTPFSFFKEDTVIANVCVYLLDAVINGKTTYVAQISGVGTLSEWRRIGLSRQLTNIGLDWAHGKHAGVFLFADRGAIPYYQKCGFKAVEEYVESVEVKAVPNLSGAIKLNPGRKQELDRIYGYAKQRAPISDKFSVLSAKLLMYHVLYTLRNHIYEIPDLNCLVFCKREKGCLSIFDIVGERIPCLKEFYPYIADENDRFIEFHFYVDKLGIEQTNTRPLLGNNLFVRGVFPVERPVFPFTSRA